MIDSDYVPGAVASILGGSATTKAGMKKKIKKQKRAALEALFSQPNLTETSTSTNSQITSLVEGKTKKKKKKKKVESSEVKVTTGKTVVSNVPKVNTVKHKVSKDQAPNSKKRKEEIKGKKRKHEEDSLTLGKSSPPKKLKPNEDVSTPVLHTGIAEISSEDDKQKKKRDRVNQRENRKKKNPEKEKRTVFVGNLPTSISKNKVMSFFKKYGSIESMRFRSAAPSDLKLPKKAIINMKSFHKERSSFHSYVVFKDAQAAKAALAANGEELEGKHIQVDLARNAKKVDQKHSLFIGNLPFDVEEESLRAHFEDCGVIENVRIVRDNKTGLGKGFGFVRFKDTDGVNFGLKFNGKQFEGRALRISKAEDMSAGKPGKKNKKSTKDPKKPETGKEKKDTKRKFGRGMPSNVTSREFQGIKAKKLEKIKKRRKQKKQKGQKTSLLEKGKGNKGRSNKVKNLPPSRGGAARARIAKKIKAKAKNSSKE